MRRPRGPGGRFLTAAEIAAGMGGTTNGDTEAGVNEDVGEGVTGQSETPPSAGAGMDEQGLSLSNFTVDPTSYVQGLGQYQSIDSFSHSGDSPESRLDGSTSHVKGGETTSPDSNRDVSQGGVDFTEFTDEGYVGFTVGDEPVGFTGASAGANPADFTANLVGEFTAGGL
jgi:hypothetical protein